MVGGSHALRMRCDLYGHGLESPHIGCTWMLPCLARGASDCVRYFLAEGAAGEPWPARALQHGLVQRG